MQCNDSNTDTKRTSASDADTYSDSSCITYTYTDADTNTDGNTDAATHSHANTDWEFTAAIAHATAKGNTTPSANRASPADSLKEGSG